MKLANLALSTAFASATLLVSGLIGTMNHAHAAAPHKHSELMQVTKTPSCGCCAGWIALAREHGFTVDVIDTNDYVKMKTDAEVPQIMQACHTTRVGGYVVEGHVPFEAIDKLLEEKPDAVGIAVPGMPMGSPGMGTNPKAVYEVYAYGKGAGESTLFFTAGQQGN